MSQLADLKDAVCSTSLTANEKAKLYWDLIQALRWEVIGVCSVDTAKWDLFGSNISKPF